MPTYDYLCPSCGHRLEVVHGVHAQGPAACPGCGGQMRKAFAPPTIHFKGSGWAKLDRRSSGGARKAGASDSGASQTGATTSEPGGMAPATTPGGETPATSVSVDKGSSADGSKEA